MAQGSTHGVPIDTDGTLTANSDSFVPSQKAAKTYVDTVGTLQMERSTLTTKGDILARSTVPVRLPAGLDGQVLQADSATTTGLKWTFITAPISSFVGINEITLYSAETLYGTYTTVTGSVA